MRKSLIVMLGIVGAGALLLAGQRASNAGDHLDSPVVRLRPQADIYDLYAWMENESTLNLAMTIPPGGFGEEVQYAFHVDSAATYGGERMETRILCTFDSDQDASCWVGDQAYVQGNARDPQNPLQTADGKLKVFTGERNDPFFFNMDGFMQMVERMRRRGNSFADPDGDGCLQLPSLTAGTLRNWLTLDQDLSAATDDFAGQNVTALVIQVDKSLVAQGGDVLGIWASTNESDTGN